MVVEPLPDSRTEGDGSVVVRVLSYNVRSLRDDEDALIRVVRAAAPDLVLVQEAPRFLGWRKHAARLAAGAGLVVLGGGAGATGSLLLCSLRAAVERTEDVLLPRTPGLHRRGLATAVVRFGAARLGVVGFHLSLQARERHTQAGLVLERLTALGAPHTLAAGDVNEPPPGRAFRRLAGRLQDCRALAPRGGEHTFPSTAPRRRIDAVFASAEVEVLGCGVPLDLPGVTAADLRAASDHLPVLAALRLPAGP
ncbi:endonuclease/exonuclease/phosphatase family protein [Streptomyces clavuligerus]|uniref:Endonuclease/exonuclease/phosphatase n=2 Tax=Streptomyces clavuligerus TaxID=1901 RepID=E2Q0M5_STRCL|nr:endonuclease/exonuclease/phosphatase family protein [Streptomyces clavuligerus]ANW20586.1 endonuclease [Streptomyces clavuligerus]AXU15212.1 endonuclease [Streptomyces clavuligerus]EFG06418.1 Endonuclease/exonuclease/phosphatase [Streptomyces clavuligerus]MBY6305285.1 endonuclease/exonuclease/phosphatase family protein [Streptomyces clavuligerus]QCS07988.1 endonuclease [Streptomyces clavuligerus]